MKALEEERDKACGTSTSTTEALTKLQTELNTALDQAEEYAATCKDQADEMRKLRAENQILIEKSDEVNADTVLELERVEQEMAETVKQVAKERDTALTQAQETAEAREWAQQALTAAEVIMMNRLAINTSFQYRVTCFLMCVRVAGETRGIACACGTALLRQEEEKARDIDTKSKAKVRIFRDVAVNISTGVGKPSRHPGGLCARQRVHFGSTAECVDHLPSLPSEQEKQAQETLELFNELASSTIMQAVEGV